jgi:hypothetical protein
MLSTLNDFSEKWLLVGRFHGYQKGDGETTYINQKKKCIGRQNLPTRPSTIPRPRNEDMNLVAPHQGAHTRTIAISQVVAVR